MGIHVIHTLPEKVDDKNQKTCDVIIRERYARYITLLHSKMKAFAALFIYWLIALGLIALRVTNKEFQRLVAYSKSMYVLGERDVMISVTLMYRFTNLK